MENFDIDAYTPAQMAARVEKAGIVKGNLDFLSMFILSIVAGAFIAFGAILYTYVIHDSSLSLGLTKLLGGAGLLPWTDFSHCCRGRTFHGK